MSAERPERAAPVPDRQFRIRALPRRLVGNNWKVALYVVLIVLCVLLAPEEPLKFIYTEF